MKFYPKHMMNKNNHTIIQLVFCQKMMNTFSENLIFTSVFFTGYDI